MAIKFDPKKDIVIIVEGGVVTDYRIPKGCTMTIVDKDADNTGLTKETIQTAEKFCAEQRIPL